MGSIPWLSKTDLTNFLRCPQGFVLTRSGAVTEVTAPGTRDHALLDAGTEFDRTVRAAAQAKLEPTKRPERMADLFTTDRFVFSEELFINSALRFRGVPDGINMAHGRLEPLEIKNRTFQGRHDLLELAFYWLLLQPHRTVTDSDPAGWLLLADQWDQPAEPVRVPFPDEVLAAVHDVAAHARAAITGELNLRWCTCPTCVQHPEIHTPRVRASAPIGTVNGVGPVRATELTAAGIGNVGQLVQRTPNQVYNALVDDVDRVPSKATIVGWQAHAKVFIAGQATMNAEPHAVVPRDYIALDLEYQNDSPAHVWMLCAQAVGSHDPHRLTVVADLDHQDRLIAELAAFLGLHPHLPVLTWGGSSADLPMLKKILELYPTPDSVRAHDVLGELRSRHCDLYAWTNDNAVLPIEKRSVKTVAQHFGIANAADSMNGLAAVSLWSRYRREQDRSILDRLIAYNRSDVALLIGVADHLRKLDDGSPLPIHAPIARDDLRFYERAEAMPSSSVERRRGLRGLIEYVRGRGC